jgi:quercetin dioxygenase-like cupin family protein
MNEEPMSTASAFVRKPEEGERLWFAGGGILTMKATCAETRGAFTLFEDRVVRGKTTPEHRHPDADELVYVLDGELRVRLDGVEHGVSKGGVYFVPRGTSHAFLVTSETAHLLCLQTPGAGEAFYRSVADPVTSSSDAARPPDLARLREGAARSPSIEFLGPSPFSR